MKKTIVLCALTFASTMALFAVFLANSILGANLTGFDPNMGKFYAALISNNLLMPFIILHIFFFICIGLLIWQLCKKEKNLQ